MDTTVRGLRLEARLDELSDRIFIERHWGLEGKGALNISPRENWVERLGGLPQYIERIAIHLVAKGMSISHAIATAVNAVKKACATGDLNWPGIQQENLGSRAEACAAVAAWEALKARA